MGMVPIRSDALRRIAVRRDAMHCCAAVIGGRRMHRDWTRFAAGTSLAGLRGALRCAARWEVEDERRMCPIARGWHARVEAAPCGTRHCDALPGSAQVMGEEGKDECTEIGYSARRSVLPCGARHHDAMYCTALRRRATMEPQARHVCQYPCPHGQGYCVPRREAHASSPTMSSATMFTILIIGLIAGPAVSLYGSPTVSPVTAA